MATLLKSIRNRCKAGKSAAGRGIGLASAYVKTLAGVSGVITDVGAMEFDRQLKLAGRKLVYRDPSMTALGGIKRVGKSVEVWGKSKDKEDSKLTPGSIMDFDTIMTSRRKDRDKDILEPKGADLDMSMPLLWQHMPNQPIGKFIKLLHRDENVLRGRYGIADTALGRDAACLVEFGALRFSHGFTPLEYEPNEPAKGFKDGEPEDEDFNGFHILKYHMMEGSLVSVPSNVDAGITAHSRGKLHSPAIKNFYGAISASRSKSVVGGFDNKGKKMPTNAKKKPVKKEAEDKEDEKPSEDDKGGKGKKLSEIVGELKAAAKNKENGREVNNRLNVLAGYCEDAADEMAKQAEAIKLAGKDGDLSDVYANMGKSSELVIGKLSKGLEEAAKILETDGLSDELKSAVEGIADGIKGTMTKMGWSETKEGEEEEDGDDDSEEKDDEASELDEEDDEEDSEEEDGDDDEEEKSEDDEEEDDKEIDEDAVEGSVKEDGDDEDDEEKGMDGSEEDSVIEDDEEGKNAKKPKSAEKVSFKRACSLVVAGLIRGEKIEPETAKAIAANLPKPKSSSVQSIIDQLRK